MTGQQPEQSRRSMLAGTAATRGEGRPLFTDSRPMKLVLAHAITFRSGAVAKYYLAA
jgi:hypothetical protein